MKRLISMAMLVAMSVGAANEIDKMNVPEGPWRSVDEPKTNNPAGLVTLAQVTGTWSSAESSRVYFSPSYGGESCASNLVSEIGKARKTIRVGAYQFTSQSMADALIKAHKKGVDVKMVVDNLAVEGRNSKVSLCASNGISVVVDRKHGIFHNKMVMIDKKTVITGSYNFTENAERRNAENMWIIEDKNTAAQCLSNWTIHASHSIPLVR